MDNTERGAMGLGMGSRLLIYLTIVGGGILIGLSADSWLTLLGWCVGLGIALNALVLAAFALRLGRADRLLGALLGSIPAGIFDACKILIFAVIVRGLFA